MQKKNCEIEDNINGAGKGGVVDKGGYGVNKNANPQNYQGDGDGGSKLETTETLMKMIELVKKLERKMVKRKIFQNLLLPIQFNLHQFPQP